MVIQIQRNIFAGIDCNCLCIVVVQCNNAAFRAKSINLRL